MRELDDKVFGGGMPVLSPLKKVRSETAFDVYTVTRRGPDTTLPYFQCAGRNGGLIVGSLELGGPIGACVYKYIERLFERLEPHYPR